MILSWNHFSQWCVQPAFMYFLHLLHSHFFLFVLWDRSSRMDSWAIRSPTDTTWWLVLRHLACILYLQHLAPRFVLMWCHARSCILCSRNSLGASSHRLYLAPELRVSQISFGRTWVVYFCLVYIVWRKLLEMESSFRFFSCRVLGLACLIMARATSDARGWFSVWSSSFLIFIMFIVLFWALRSRMFRPPAFYDFFRWSIAIEGIV